MALTVSRFSLYNFRNYNQLQLSDIAALNIFVGENGIGKTNILEALSYISSLSSFRSVLIEELVNEGESESSIIAALSGDDRSLETKMEIADGKRRYYLNGKKKSARELRGLMPAVSFVPDDLLIVKGSNGKKRDFFDHLGAQISKNYAAVLADYEKVIRQKNAILKNEEDDALLTSINALVVTCGAQLTYYRAALFNKVLPLLQEKYELLASSKEEIAAQYQPSWNEAGSEALKEKTQIVAGLEQELLDRAAEERIRKRAVVGPHTDKIELLLDGKPAAKYASQGQQRSIVLALKMAEAEIIRDSCGQEPILLLDDVMSELDENRREKLMSSLDDYAQVFITTTNLGYFEEDLLKKATIYHLPYTQE